ncbi:endonuclease/exonuclease/phosphatase family protein [Sphingobacterium sp. lm-10]|uniref:endonuclease/exonuclease/phosphatase family protein n=1 Tax=Sphingobacterium sp. lm-10 TaxID=2944904 RepID=UPI00202016D0|nr:endonuclease/exonuclease/phosphatase family protein [Sphingobacterium sp. lm-10]MCL7988712.1 endonuclease/exonuclease/phosphatase family protein [Sphingobacterium sp. lm-10]
MPRHTNKLGFFSKSVLLINVLAVLALIASYSASFINPTFFWPTALFGLAYPPILLANIIFVIYWLVRRPLFALASFVTILIGWPLMTKHVAFNSVTEHEKDSVLRVMSYNVHLFEAIQDRNTHTQDSVIKLVQDNKPDVLCMQEFQSTVVGEQKFTEKVKKTCGFKDYYFSPANKNSYHGYGHVVFSKYPIVDAGVINDYSYGINRIVFTDIVKDLDTIRIYNVHLRSFLLQDEDKDFIKNPSGAQDEKVATKRVGRKLKDAFYYRSRQVEHLLAHFDTTKYPKLVMGDFNDTPMSYSVNTIGKNMNNAFQKKGNGWGVTHFEVFPILQIDYIFSDFEVLDYGIIKRKFSDHYPIWADVKL